MHWYRIAYKKVCPTAAQQGGRTVRFAFPALVLVSAFVGMALSIGSESSYVRIETNPENIEAGQEFTIAVYASAKVPTNAVDITVAYPEDQIDVLGVDTGESVITIWTEQPYAKDGSVYIRGGVFRKGFLGEHLVARIRAKALAAGEAKILTSHTEFLAGDGMGTKVAVDSDGSDRTSVSIAEAGAALKSAVRIGLVTDIDSDGDVDITDIGRFLSAWNSGKNVFDFNGDGRMTFTDFGILLAESFFK